MRFLVLTAAAIILLVLNILLALIVFQSMKKKPTTGKEGMIGEQGVVISTIKHEGKVSVHGEIWQAESHEILHKGEKVVIQKVEGLKLLVKRYLKSENLL